MTGTHRQVRSCVEVVGLDAGVIVLVRVRGVQDLLGLDLCVCVCACVCVCVCVTMCVWHDQRTACS